MAFKDIRRQKFLSESRAEEREDDLIYRIKTSTPEISDLDNIADARGSFAWSVATSSLELLILRYTAGQPVDVLASELSTVIAAFDRYIPFDNPPPNEARTLTITQLEAYVYIFWLLALCQLLGHAQLIPTVLAWLDPAREFSRGRDGLFESVVERLGQPREPTERVLLHPLAYKPLAKVTVAAAEERPALMKEFLDGWYKNMNECYWQGTHADGSQSYFGYWCFEAALVSVLWDIDDSTYRDHLVYPKDLADYGRTPLKAATPLPSNPSNSVQSEIRCEGGKPCPQAGIWSTLASPDSTRRFAKGEVMPDFPHSRLGATIWNWHTE